MNDRFKTVEWAHHTNIYEVNLRQYSLAGTINEFAKSLPRLKDMGVHTIWFMPLTPISQKNKKGTLGSYYACSDHKKINPEFGTASELKSFIKLAHEMGFKIIIDWVANHTGWDHTWTIEHPEYYKKDPITNDFNKASGMDDIIELDFSKMELRSAMIEAMRFWISEFDIDGFRCDLAFWVVLDFWKEARKELDAIKPLLWLGEFDELDKPEYGEAFDASYTWTWMHQTEKFYKQGLTLATMISVIKRYDDIGDRSMRAWFTSNHDENSWNGTEYEKFGDMALLLAVFSATWNGVPLIYSGQELPNKKRLKFFDKDPIAWADKNALHDFYKNLLELHRDHPALKAGDPAVQTFILKTTEAKNIFAYLRRAGDREVLVILNFSSDIVSFNMLPEQPCGIMKADPGKDIEMNAWEYKILQK